MSVTIPLTFYVVFHPECEESRALADALFRWFRMQHEGEESTEAGLPIWYRCALAQMEKDGTRVPADPPRLDPPIEFGDAALNVVIVLVSDRIGNDRAWRHALDRDLSPHLPVVGEELPRRVLVLPAAVDDSLYRLTFLTSRAQALRFGPPPPEKGEEKEEKVERRARRAILLRRAVMEVVARRLRHVDGPLDPLRVFISHAKADGTEVAERVRDGLASHSQLRTWYDANELPPGLAWHHPLMDAAGSNTAALVSVVSDAYASRYWCRREVELAREPRMLAKNPKVWTVQPAVAVHAEEQGFSRPMAPLSQVVHVGWDPTGGSVERVVDRLLLEVLLAEFYRQLCQLRAVGTGDDTVLLTFTPDPWTFTRLTGVFREEKRALPKVVAYPGFGLRAGDLEGLTRLARDLGYDANVRFVTLEELGERQLGGNHGTKRPRAVLSAGGDLAGTSPWGAGPLHTDDVVVRLSRRLLRAGWRLAYGGTLADLETDITRSLFSVATGYTAEHERDATESERVPAAPDLDEPPLHNYVAWPYHLLVSARRRAALVGICSFEFVKPAALASVLEEQQQVPHSPLKCKLTADALTEMRRRTASARLRVAVGGKVTDWLGWLPGVAEEVEVSLTSRQPLVILGQFGGTAGLLARFLDGGDWPRELTFEHAAEHEGRFRELLEHPGARRVAHERFQRLRETLDGFRTEYARGGDTVLFPSAPSLSAARFAAILRTSSPTRLINLVAEVAEELST